MPTELPDELKRSIRDRDDYRCRECGVLLDTEARGCPYIRTGPHARSGTEDAVDFLTLCFACHATKGLSTLAALLRTAVPDRLPEFVKQMTRDFGLNLLAYSEWIDPLRFDSARALEEFRMWRGYLDTIATLAGDARSTGDTGVLHESAQLDHLADNKN